MDRSGAPNERDSDRQPGDAILPPRWNAPGSPTYPSASLAGPSSQPWDPRDRPEHGWSPRSHRTSEPDAWFTEASNVPRSTEGFGHFRPIGEVPIGVVSSGMPMMYPGHAPLVATPAPPVPFRRTSAEEWQRYEDQHTAQRAAPLGSGLMPSLNYEPVPVRSRNVTAPSGDSDPPRARMACTFCRVRKLRCDGATPCRHCERRSIDCVYAPFKTKTKGAARGPSSSDKGQPDEPSVGSMTRPDSGSKSSNDDARDRSAKRSEPPNHSGNASGSYGALNSKRRKSTVKQARRSSAGQASGSNRDASSSIASTPSSSMPGSDLAMIQNNNTSLPMEPTFGDHDAWWNQLLSIFGRSRATSMRLVQHLLTRFVQSNAVFFGLLHAPTLLSVVSGSQGRIRADPALYLAVLAVSACDMHQHRLADERTSDMRSANEASRRLASRLSEMAANYLETATAHGCELTPATGQAASILALTQPDGSTEQKSLIRLAENVVRTLKLHETVSSREPLLQDSEPDSPLYWSRPLTSDSPESEVKYESLVRLCWTGISHRFRMYIAKPDEAFGDEELPEFIQEIRPMAFWQPSLLPADLPPPFFHSQDLMRRSAHLSRLTVTLSKIEKVTGVGEDETPSAEVLEQVKRILKSLDSLEAAFVRHRPRSEAERNNVLGRTLQMFCRMHVWVRLTIWRKYGLWNDPNHAKVETSASAADEEGAAPSEQQLPLFEQQHPTIEFWTSILHEMISGMQQDFDAHVVGSTTLKTTGSEVEMLARHVICACDLIQASGQRQPLKEHVDSALNILKRVQAYAEMNESVDGLRISEDIAEKVRAVEARDAALQQANNAAHTVDPQLN